MAMSSRALLLRFSRCTFVTNFVEFIAPNVEKLLKNVFSYSVEEVNFVLKHADLKDNIVKCSDIEETVSILKAAKISGSDILRFPWIISLCPSDLKNKIELLSAIGLAENLILPLLKLPLETLQITARRSKFTSPSLFKRVSYLCEFLELKPEALGSYLTHHYLLTMDFNKLQRIAQLLKNAKVPVEHIVRDLWIFNYNDKFLSDRFKLMKAAKAPVKLWVMRSSEQIFESWLEKWKQKVAIFGDKGDHVDYLARCLVCSQEYVRNDLVKKNPRLLSINAPKLKQMLDLLFENGYTSKDICEHPLVLSRGVNTVQKRISELKALGCEMPYLKVVMSTHKNYDIILQKLKLPPDGSST